MNIINVKTLSRDYDILIRRDISEDVEAILSESFGTNKKIFFITNEKIFDIHGNKIVNKIKNNQELNILVLKDGEEYKSQDTLTGIYEFFIKNNAHRDSIVIAFGGGVIGDTVGYAAATFNRGLILIQYPTTIISQVDSSIGGKVAINFKGIKNVIGCFYQPHLIITDPLLLETLDENDLINGLGEIVKYGLVFDFGIIETINKIINENPFSEDRLKKMVLDERFIEIILKCSKIKADII
ncbi:MAG: 3-dehydroquinate synthase, partial [Actinomycetota bacterium]|nr:3-dehydroquinate synthase [Actinomycetota bacterium]